MDDTINKSAPRTYEVGYCRPPKTGQWIKGQSGNPRGRRKQSSDLAECVVKVLAETGLANINGRTERLSYAEALARKLVQKALEGNASALRELIRMQQDHAARLYQERDIEIEAQLVFDEEENRLMKLAEENRQLAEEVQRLRALPPAD